jgi:hypothetical protein
MERNSADKRTLSFLFSGGGKPFFSSKHASFDPLTFRHRLSLCACHALAPAVSAIVFRIRHLLRASSTQLSHQASSRTQLLVAESTGTSRRDSERGAYSPEWRGCTAVKKRKRRQRAENYDLLRFFRPFQRLPSTFRLAPTNPSARTACERKREGQETDGAFPSHSRCSPR